MAAVLPPPAPPTTDLALHGSPASPQLALLSSPEPPPLKRIDSSTSSATTTTTGKGDGAYDPGLDEPLDNPVQEEARANAYAGAPLVELTASPKPTGPHCPRLSDVSPAPVSLDYQRKQPYEPSLQAQVQAQAHRRTSSRNSVSVSPLDPNPSLIALRRHSAAARSESSSSTPGVASASPPRVWHPKPLVLTPARSVHTPLTSTSPTSPSRRRPSAPLSDIEGASPRHNRKLSTSSSGGFSRTTSPSADRLTPSPHLPTSNASYRRRSLNYLDKTASSPANLQQRYSLAAGPSARQLAAGLADGPLARRVRTESADTALTYLSGDSLLARGSGGEGQNGESPDSSVEEWSDEKEGQLQRHQVPSAAGTGSDGNKAGERSSPLMSDGEWEREYQRRSALPLAVVEEADGQERSSPEETASVSPKSTSTVGPLPPPKDHPPFDPSSLPGLAPTINLTASTPSTTHAAGSPSILASPKSAKSPKFSSSQVRTPRAKSRYDEHWNGEATTDSATDNSDASPRPPRKFSATASPLRSAHDSVDTSNLSSPSETPPKSETPTDERPRSMTPRKGKPIVIKSVTARSSAANLRRSQRLSQIDPPLVDPSPHRLSRTLRRLSGVGPASPPTSPKAAASPKEQHTTRSPVQPRSPISPPRDESSRARRASSPQIRRASSPQVRRVSSPHLAQIPPVANHSWTGLAIWPPPAETKTVSLGAPLGYDSDSSRDLSGLESETEDEGTTSGSAGRVSRSNGFRRPVFEPRNPRAAQDEADFGPESWLEVLLNEEPPPRRSSRQQDDFAQRWSAYSGSTMDTYKKGSAGSSMSGTSSSTVSPGKSSGLTKKIFERVKKPISIAPQSQPARRRDPTKPRPIVSGPLELQAASSAMRQQHSQSSAGSSAGSQSFGSLRSSPSHSATSLRRPSGPYAPVTANSLYSAQPDDVAEELASLKFDSTDDLRASLDTVFCPAPKPYSLPPGLLSHGVAAPAPPRHRRVDSNGSIIESPSPNGSYTSLLGSSASSPYARSRQGSRDSAASGSLAFPSPSNAVKMQRNASLSSNEPMPIREVLRGQALER
ncbi:hypothetical protein Rhopal_001494-T1 [Rhodotorula paludigena]|uniref:Proteophosphoglycan ppg4 n=1 Tax=Rhodotorula paludigena TaxID=86838 RepID=A0AAV5GEH7_9BASI|nr:hypothetical protein Rhopal_001494-T1 [Rhodotorula paludigena]